MWDEVWKWSDMVLTGPSPTRISTYSLNSWENISDGKGVSVYPYTHPQHGKIPNHLKHVEYLFIGEFAIFQVLTHLVPYLQI